MTDKELKKLTRTELLQILLQQAEEIENLRNRVDDLNTQIQNRNITCEKAGNIADAVLELSGFYESAEVALRLYIQSVLERVALELEVDMQISCDTILLNAKRDMKEFLSSGSTRLSDYSRARSHRIALEARDKLRAIKMESDAKWEAVDRQLNNLLE